MGGFSLDFCVWSNFTRGPLFDQHCGQGCVILRFISAACKMLFSARKTGSSIAYILHGKNFVEVFFLSVMTGKSGKRLETL